ncbi:hypothetical protein AQI88_14940 [Streptomyces cellostaticus]|uniref:Peptidase S8/S53 domain-containing protein n=1 Tax=Streptomyces cellostaticus TaxID=67285 RepID=A0A101NMU5_9ACTN|nr:hypothetical protein AQI88_14940 [Streptomyces cellostaticus]GHI02653.1 hypothetical protein Scel_09740 [Streptomyces cellostaticus]
MLQCAGTPKKGYASCNALRVTSGTTAPGRAGGEEGHRTPDRPAERRRGLPTGYGPSNLQSAYGLTSAASASGSGRTIAIVDAYDDPNAESDLTNTHGSQALMPLSGASPRSAPPRAAPTPVLCPGGGIACASSLPRHSEGMRNSNSGRSHGTAGGFASAVPVRTAPTRW